MYQVLDASAAGKLTVNENTNQVAPEPGLITEEETFESLDRDAEGGPASPAAVPPPSPPASPAASPTGAKSKMAMAFAKAKEIAKSQKEEGATGKEKFSQTVVEVLRKEENKEDMTTLYGSCCMTPSRFIGLVGNLAIFNNFYLAVYIA